jgi:uncharacterized protein YciI
VKYVLLYESAENVAERAPRHAAAHRKHWHPFRERGELLLIGPFGDPQGQGAMAVFKTREAAEEFARNDPFVLGGVVRSWEVREWDESIGPES